MSSKSCFIEDNENSCADDHSTSDDGCDLDSVDTVSSRGSIEMMHTSSLLTRSGTGKEALRVSQRRKVWVRRFWLLCFSAVYAVLVRENIRRQTSTRVFIMSTVSAALPITCYGLYEWLRLDSSRLSRQIGWVLLMLCLKELLEQCEFMFTGPDSSENDRFAGLALVAALSSMQYYVALGAVQHRVEITEDAYGARRYSRRIFVTRCLAAIPDAILCFTCTVAWLLEYDKKIQLVGHSSRSCVFRDLGIVVVWTAATYIVWRSFARIIGSAARAQLSQTVNSYVYSETVWALTVLWRMRLASTTSCATYAILNAWFCFLRLSMFLGIGGPTLRTMSSRSVSSLVTALETLVEFLCILVMVGFFRPLRPDIEISTKRTRSGSKKVTPNEPSQSPAWSAKVRELAQRSMSVAALLQFYDRLGPGGDLMPHFDPSYHTTNDVVRSGIIPASLISSGGGVAYSVLHSAPPAPRAQDTGLAACMVTHTWSNLFVNLVAAVIADALGLDEYEVIVETLTHQGTTSLSETLLMRGALEKRYWICAFCINQHANICSSFGKSPPLGTEEHYRWQRSCHDTILGMPHARCPCTERKFLNDAPDKCELNKFDDMMEFLRKRVPNFCHLAAVDPAFDTFSRLWCIAEFVQAYRSGISQHVCLFSSRVLDFDNEDLSLYAKLANLSVLQCSASRPEDKAAILAKIPDVDDFDAQLQNVIFGERGLLSHWYVGFDVLSAAARTAFRARVASDHSGHLLA